MGGVREVLISSCGRAAVPKQPFLFTTRMRLLGDEQPYHRLCKNS